jgi:hypothetical protein
VRGRCGPTQVRILGFVALADELDRIGGLATAHAKDGDAVAAVIPTEPAKGRRVYLCAFDGADGYRSWLALDDEGSPLTTRRDLRAAVSIAALCEVAAEAAGGGDLDDLIRRLAELREREAPPGIEEAEAAARALRVVLGEPPQLATPARLDDIGVATRRLERELDSAASSPFAAAMKASQDAVGELQREVEAGYREALS